MPLNKEVISRLNATELYAVFSSDAFSGQRGEMLETLQRKNGLGYDAFTGAHRDEGCKTVYVFREFSESPFVYLDLMHLSYKHWSFYCRKHGVSSETFVDISFPEEPSNIDAEKNRFSFVQHIIRKEPESESLVQAWNKFEDFILSWAKDYEGLHYLSDYSGKIGSISPFLEKVQLGVKSLSNQERSNENSIMTAGLLNHLVFGVDHNFGILLEDLTGDDKGKAILFCKEMLPNDSLPNNLRLLESVNWGKVIPSG